MKVVWKVRQLQQLSFFRPDFQYSIRQAKILSFIFSISQIKTLDPKCTSWAILLHLQHCGNCLLMSGHWQVSYFRSNFQKFLLPDKNFQFPRESCLVSPLHHPHSVPCFLSSPVWTNTVSLPVTSIVWASHFICRLISLLIFVIMSQ